MSGEHFYVRGALARPGKPAQPNAPRGTPATGRITRIMVGQGHGFIRLRDDREIFFHRGDMADRSAFNDLQVGHAVTFELLEDAVSGARALRVRPQKSGR